MKAFFLFACAALTYLQSADAANYALIVAGSNGYDNYRHQADICHAFHILRKHGIPEENIVTMMYDDIANSEENPFPGNIINQPGGKNLYPGVVIDYKGKDVTPEVFLAALSGDKAQIRNLTNREGKVINSGPNDHVFVNFADHGAPGLIAFPETFLYAKPLMKTLKKMHKNKQYKKLVLYIEACESGSMFNKLLPRNLNIFASTAANPDQSSYACYFDDKRQTYLGDVYSVNWMQDSDKENLQSETLAKQFKVTKDETNTSQVMEYGDLSISSMTVAEFQGDQALMTSPYTPIHPDGRPEILDAVAAPDVPLQILEHKLRLAASPSQKRRIAQQIQELEQHNEDIDSLLQSAVSWLQSEGRLRASLGAMDTPLKFTPELSLSQLRQERRPISQWECYQSSVETLRSACPSLRITQDYHILRQLYLLVNLCERGYEALHIRLAVRDAALKHPQLCRL